MFRSRSSQLFRRLATNRRRVWYNVRSSVFARGWPEGAVFGDQKEENRPPEQGKGGDPPKE